MILCSQQRPSRSKATLTVVQFLDRIVDVTKEAKTVCEPTWAGPSENCLKYSNRSPIRLPIKRMACLEGSMHVQTRQPAHHHVCIQKTYRDIRSCGAPPESVVKFGGDTDNWEWPRHTGDFSVFRVYASKDGKPGRLQQRQCAPLNPNTSFR